MSFATDIFNYIASNQTITAVIPASSVYNRVVPESLPLPYLVYTDLGSTSEYTMSPDYYAVKHFQISVFSNTDSEAESIAITIMQQFGPSFATALASNCFALLQNNYMLIPEDESLGFMVFHAMIDFDAYMQASHL